MSANSQTPTKFRQVRKHKQERYIIEWYKTWLNHFHFSLFCWLFCVFFCFCVFLILFYCLILGNWSISNFSSNCSFTFRNREFKSKEIIKSTINKWTTKKPTRKETDYTGKVKSKEINARLTVTSSKRSFSFSYYPKRWLVFRF